MEAKLVNQRDSAASTHAECMGVGLTPKGKGKREVDALLSFVLQHKTGAYTVNIAFHCIISISYQEEEKSFHCSRETLW
jgi:hypothetical protein